MEKGEKSRWAGKFSVPPGKDIYGELTLSGAKTSLYLHDKDFFSTHSIPHQCIQGVLHDLTKISLINCITTSGPGSGNRGEERYHFSSQITTGPDPEILYFTGKKEIFTADTVLGRVSASHNPSHNLGGPDGVRLTNTILVTLAFKEPVIFDESILRASTLLRYLGMLVGRPQNLLRLSLRMSPIHRGQSFSKSIAACHQTASHRMKEKNRILPTC